MAQKPRIAVTGLDQFISDISTQLSDALSQAVQVGFSEGLAASRRLLDANQGAGPHQGRATRVAERNAQPPASAKKVCIVPQCSRRSNAKELCPAHYLKARRLGFDNPFTSKQLATLAEDGRKLRAAQKPPPRQSEDA